MSSNARATWTRRKAVSESGLRETGFRTASAGSVLFAFFVAVRITLNPVSAKHGLGLAFASHPGLPGYHTHKAPLIGDQFRVWRSHRYLTRFGAQRSFH
jgi:hypothetical protein